ncbi:hypothetical protein CGCSCA5_v002826 [Colletotrichum siamense]|nr:hypothetical protein CGCSCA5_v002826 [Colletotrichum siamense]
MPLALSKMAGHKWRHRGCTVFPGKHFMADDAVQSRWPLPKNAINASVNAGRNTSVIGSDILKGIWASDHRMNKLEILPAVFFPSMTRVLSVRIGYGAF